jgi:two-component system cell cycle response regulator
VSDIQIIEELKLTGRLPSPPGVGMAILELTRGDDFSIADVARAIQSDPALTGRILKLANSSAYASVSPIATVDEAVNRIGISTLRNLALGFSLIGSYREGACQEFDFEGFWSESLASALAAQQISSALQLGNPSEAYVCGLLYRIGKLGLACVHPSAYGEILTAQKGTDLWGAELDAFDVHHGALGEAMLLDWGLPSKIASVLSVRPDEVDLESADQTMVDLRKIMSIAEPIARACVGAEENTESLSEALQNSGMTAAEFEAWCNQVAHSWQEWGAILKLTTRSVPPIKLDEQSSSASPKRTESERLLAEMGGRKCRILIIDEDALSVQILSKTIADTTHEVTTCRDGAKALGVILESLPDIVICSADLSRTSSIELVNTLRGYGDGQQVYFVMLSGNADPEVELEAYSNGVDDFIQKPCDPPLVRAHILAGTRLVLMKREIRSSRKKLEAQVAEMAVLNRRLMKASMTDSLTGLPNRRAAMESLKTNWAEAKRDEGRPVALMMIDIDHFKMVNDTFGHDIGDEVLRETANAFRAQARAGEQVSRIGGEEFLVSAVISPEEAEVSAERLRAAIESNHIKAGIFDQNVTVSIGVAYADPRVEGYEAILKSADEALYYAKKSGRNQIHVLRPGALV